MNNPIKHHYIPQSILARFCDKNNQLHSYNKVFGKLNARKYSPAAVCYEENLHTLIHKEEKSYQIESFYSKVEGEFLKFIRAMDDWISDGHDPASLPKTEQATRVIAIFLAISFWRVPSRLGVAKEARKKLREIYDNSSDENKDLLGFDRQLIRLLERKKKNISLKFSQFMILPVLLNNRKSKAIQECWFYKTNYDLLISDDPVICDLNDDYSMGGKIYYPIGSRLCITNTPGEIDRFQKEIFNRGKKIVMGKSVDCFSEYITDGKLIAAADGFAAH